ncbi:CPBP family glutamic-type intramembrane protease [Sphingobacterium griseoflavum]|uniref:CAAX prenyl protease 2/Lysostaphin resistance protein A-like domain-containing protein n=1 Tax=Sphingobacterium griseoflavum TaxID=1474952 RepID=A0ABQ3HT57_9SPHI|nr:CPBP family glutamic-type intramembrane protease [Sphingobacterium griseoflavum]GHE32072.1 hypothetical protein GCM10017764_14060 [Sphingobacterium griseoflavum]
MPKRNLGSKTINPTDTHMIIKEFYNFLRSNPNEIDEVPKNFKRRALVLLKVLVFFYALKLLWSAAQLFLVQHHIISDAKGTDGSTMVLSESGAFAFILEFVLLAPLLEELAFRGILQKKPALAAAGLSTIFLCILILLFRIQIYSISAASITSIFAAAAVYLILVRSPRLLQEILIVRNRHMRGILWLSAIAFSFWHFYNFDFTQSSPLTIAWYLAPHFIVAWLLSWVSLRYGFFTAYALHMCNNLLPTLFILYANNL